MEKLDKFRELIIELNALSPDVAILDLKHNNDAYARVIRGIKEFRIKTLVEFENYLREERNKKLTNKINKTNGQKQVHGTEKQ